jgi:hypothetical protein
MLLALLLHCYSQGIFSSREMERATYRDVSVRFLTGNTHPDHSTIAMFRTRNRRAIAQCFVSSLLYAKEIGLLKVGTISVDGTVIQANANRDRNLPYHQLDAFEQYVAEEVERRMKAAEAADAQAQPVDRLPAEFKDLKALEEQLRQARNKIEERERQRREHEQESVRRSQDKPPRSEEEKEKARSKPVKPKPHASANRTDMDSRLMKDKKGGFDQCYNAQAVADADGSQLILAARVPDAAVDQFELEPDVTSVPPELGEITTILADCGYANIEQIERLESQGKDIYVSVRSRYS